MFGYVNFLYNVYTSFHSYTANLTSSDPELVISAEPHGMIDPVMMYQSSKLTLSMRYKECLYQGISCKTSKTLGDIRLTFQFEDKESWALEVGHSLDFHYNSI